MKTNDGSTILPISATDDFIAEFENWYLQEFRPILTRRAWEQCPDPSETTPALLPWVTRLRDLGEQGVLHSIKPQPASELLFLLNRALDGLGDEYRRGGASQGMMMLALSPIEDILVYLSVVSSKVANEVPEAISETRANSSFDEKAEYSR